MKAEPSAPTRLPAYTGLVEWLRPGEYDRAERVVAALRRLGVERLRTCISWADFHRPDGQCWYDWLLPRLARDLDVLPCVTYTPPSLGIRPKSSSPPRDSKAYADFCDLLVTRYGAHFEWMQLWNEPNNLNDWDWLADQDWLEFSRMVGGAAYWLKRRRRKTVLAGTCPTDPHWLALMCKRGVMDHIDAVGAHGFPGTWDADWRGWPHLVTGMREVLAQHCQCPEIWITEAGYSTWRNDEAAQVDCFLETVAAPVERIYWYALEDLDPETPSQEGFHFDERHYHLGMTRTDGTPKLLYRLLEQGGVAEARTVTRLRAPASSHARKPVVITGGAGFVGTNLADRLAGQGQPVLIYDNLGRPGVERNIAWLRERHGDRIGLEIADVRDPYALRSAVRQASKLFHLAAQVAVTTSVSDPVTDFDINLRGTLNLLEAIRTAPEPPPLVFASTNKVYGKLGGLKLAEHEARYLPLDAVVRRHGVSERQPLDLHSPYGCSKGGADQYALDYARIYNLPAVVFRMSCLYGPHQLGTEDQGWVAHFLISSLKGRPITVFGDGKQVRDVLYVDDVVDAYLLAQTHMPRLSGMAFNIGGGGGNAISLLDLLQLIVRLNGRLPDVSFGPWRPGDQLYYVSDTRRFRTLTGWRPRVHAEQGVALLFDWLQRRFDTAVPTSEGISA